MASVYDFYRWKNFAANEPLDLVSVRRWVGWTEIDHCQVCSRGPFSMTYEIELEWGDTKKYEYISEICGTCLHRLNKDFIRNKSDKY